MTDRRNAKVNLPQCIDAVGRLIPLILSTFRYVFRIHDIAN